MTGFSRSFLVPRRKVAAQRFCLNNYLPCIRQICICVKAAGQDRWVYRGRQLPRGEPTIRCSLVSFEGQHLSRYYLPCSCLGAYRGFCRIVGFTGLLAVSMTWQSAAECLLHSGVNGPEVEFLHVGVAAQVRERSLVQVS